MKKKPAIDSQVKAKMSTRRRNGKFFIGLPLFDEPQQSKTRKSFVIASSRGVRKSRLKVGGTNIHFVAYAFYYGPERVKGLGKTESKSSTGLRRARRKTRRRANNE